MTVVTVSSKYQIVIPKEVRDAFGIYPGQKMQFLACNNRLALVPLKPMREMKGFLLDLNTEVARDNDRI